MRLPFSTCALIRIGALALVGACGGGGSGGAGVPPQSLSYPALAAVPETCLALAELAPSVAGGPPTRFSVSPALPQGLQLDATTGVLRGTPTQSAPMRAYTVTASNSAGSATAELRFEVREVALAGLDYGGSTLPLAIGVHAQLAPVLASGRAASFEVTSGALPPGVLLDPSSGVLAGTPAASALAQPFTITLRARDCRDAWLELSLAFDVGLPKARAAIVLNDGEPILSTYLPAAESGALAAFEHALGTDTAASEALASPDGRVLFLAEGDRAAVTSCLRSSEGRWLPTGHEASTGQAAAIALAASGTRLCALTAEPRLLVWNVDPTSGAFVFAGETLDLPAEPMSLALAPSGRFAFVAGAYDAELATLALDPTDGAPGVTLRLAGAGALASLAVSRGGDYLIGADLAGGLRTFAIHPQSGALSPVAGTPVATGSGAGAVWAHPFADLVVSARSFEGFLDVFVLGANGSLLPLASSPVAIERAATRLCATPDGTRLHALVEHFGWLGFDLASDGSLSPCAAPRCAQRGGARSMAFVPGARADQRVARELFAAGSAQPRVFSVEPDGSLVAKPVAESVLDVVTHVEAHPWMPVAYVTRAGQPPQVADIAADGTLVPRGALATSGSSGLFVDPSGRFAYELVEGAGARIRCWTVQPDGALEAGGEMLLPDGPLALAFHPSGEFLHVACTGGASLETYAIDWATGELVEWGTTLFGATPRTLAIDASGTLLAALDAAGSSVHVFALDAPTGMPYLLPGGYLPLGSGASTLVFTPEGGRLLIGGAHGALVSAFSVDRSSGALSAAGVVPGPAPLATVIGSDGCTLYAALPGGIVARIDCDTLASIDSTTLGVDATALSLRLKLR